MTKKNMFTALIVITNTNTELVKYGSVFGVMEKI